MKLNVYILCIFSAFSLCTDFAWSQSDKNVDKTKLVVIEITYKDIDINQLATIQKGVGFGRHYDSYDQKGNNLLPVVINGPLVGSEGDSVGMVMESKNMESRTFEPIDPNDTSKNGFSNFKYKNSVFGLVNVDGQDKLKLIQIGDWNWNTSSYIPSEIGLQELSKASFYWAFQNGPALLIDGVNEHNSNSSNRTIRTGLGFKSDGTIVYIKSGSDVSFYEFAEIFRQQGASNAIYLDGLDENQIGYYINQGDKKVDWMYDERIKIQFYHADFSYSSK